MNLSEGRGDVGEAKGTCNESSSDNDALRKWSEAFLIETI